MATDLKLQAKYCDICGSCLRYYRQGTDVFLFCPNDKCEHYKKHYYFQGGDIGNFRNLIATYKPPYCPYDGTRLVVQSCNGVNMAYCQTCSSKTREPRMGHALGYDWKENHYIKEEIDMGLKEEFKIMENISAERKEKLELQADGLTSRPEDKLLKQQISEVVSTVDSVINKITNKPKLITSYEELIETVKAQAEEIDRKRQEETAKIEHNCREMVRKAFEQIGIAVQCLEISSISDGGIIYRLGSFRFKVIDVVGENGVHQQVRFNYPQGVKASLWYDVSNPRELAEVMRDYVKEPIAINMQDGTVVCKEDLKKEEFTVLQKSSSL